MSVLYLYAVLAAAPREVGLGRGLGVGLGLADEPLVALAAHGLVVVAGWMERAPAAGADELARHDAVVRRLARRVESLLPLRFGQVVADDAELTACVERALPRLSHGLERVAGCEQMTLRCHGRVGRARAAASQPALVPGEGPGTSYLRERRKQRADARTAPAELAPLLASVASLVRAARVERASAGPLAASVYHLVKRGDAAAYRATIERAMARGSNGVTGGDDGDGGGLSALRVDVRGPFPPYAFAGELEP